MSEPFEPLYLAGLIGRLVTFKVPGIDEADYEKQGPRTVAPADEADVVTSVHATPDGAYPGGETRHAVVLDLDVPAKLVASSTPGHSHLYIDVRAPESEYMRLLEALAACGVIEEGYFNASQARGHTAVRLPWVRKGEGTPAIKKEGTL